MCRIGVLAVLAVLAAACGGSPAAPAEVDPQLVLSSGPHRLVLHPSTGLQTCTGGFCSTTVLCVGLPPGAPGVVPVTVARSGEEATVRSTTSGSTLVMMLRISGNTVSGVISGRGYDASGVPVDVKGPGDAPAAVIGGAATNGFITGTLKGHVSIGSSSCSGDQSAWSLEPVR